VLAGSAELIDEAWRYKQMWGGAMRQAGIVAAAGLYALDHHVERLADDHANARTLAEGLAEIDGIELDPERVATNIVVFEVPDAPAFCAVGPRQVRAVTHLDVDAAGIEEAIVAARSTAGAVSSVTAK
jgi:threonine aldolase